MTRSSRDKLNSLRLGGAVLAGAVVGGYSGSVELFFVVSGALVLASLASGEIRPPGRRDRR